MDELIEVEHGVRLALRRHGAGGPPVVCLSCAGGAHDEWGQVVERLRGHTEVITSGRPTLGGSDPLPAELAERTVSIGWTAGQLRTLLQRAGIAGPYVLVTSSVGSWIADQYAATWPGEVAGMVLVDPTNLSPWPEAVDLGGEIRDGGDQGCVRWSWNEAFAELARSTTPTGPARCVVLSASDASWESESRSSSPWWHPLTLGEAARLWQGFQREWACRLHALHVVADTAGHFVHRDQPDLVAHVVRAVLAAARAGAPVQLDPQQVAAAAGRIEPSSG